MNKLVSVVMPVYNPKSYALRALRSVIDQTHPTIEILVVDDGSKINIEEFFKDYLSDIKIIHQQNSGPAGARNAAIKAAQGEFIAFLDQDDLWMPNKISAQIREFDKNDKLGLVSSWVCIIRGDNDDSVESVVKITADRDDCIRTLKIHNLIQSPSVVMVKKECFDTVGMFDRDIMGCEDRDMWYRIVCKYDIHFISEPLTKYRRHSSNLHHNVPMMTRNQIKYIRKHRETMALLEYLRAMSYVRLDAAREYYVALKPLRVFWNACLSIMWFPLRCVKNDDKYQLVAKSIIYLIFRHAYK